MAVENTVEDSMIPTWTIVSMISRSRQIVAESHVVELVIALAAANALRMLRDWSDGIDGDELESICRVEQSAMRSFTALGAKFDVFANPVAPSLSLRLDAVHTMMPRAWSIAHEVMDAAIRLAAGDERIVILDDLADEVRAEAIRAGALSETITQVLDAGNGRTNSFVVDVDTVDTADEVSGERLAPKLAPASKGTLKHAKV